MQPIIHCHHTTAQVEGSLEFQWLDTIGWASFHNFLAIDIIVLLFNICKLSSDLQNAWTEFDLI